MPSQGYSGEEIVSIVDWYHGLPQVFEKYLLISFDEEPNSTGTMRFVYTKRVCVGGAVQVTSRPLGYVLTAKTSSTRRKTLPKSGSSL